MVPARLIQELQRGSYEQIVDELSVTIAESYSRFGSDSPESVHLVASFPRHAIVATDEGKFFRAEIKDIENNKRAVVKTESIDVPVLTDREQQKQFVEGAVSDAVMALLGGDEDEARTRVRELVRSADLIVGPDPIDSISEALEGLSDSERTWRRVYFENQAGIHKFMWGSSGVSHRDSPKPKYQELYSGNRVEDASGYNQAISADLQVVSEGLSKIWDGFQSSYVDYSEQDGKFYPLAIAGVNESFQEFAGDFADELRVICSLVESASKDLNPDTIRARAVLFDHVARQYPAIEIASKLIQRTSAELKS
jgi:hypothetical protein